MNRLNHTAIAALLVISVALLMGGCDSKKDLTRERALSILKQTNMREKGLTFAGGPSKKWYEPNVKPGSDGDPYWKFMFLLEVDGLVKIVNHEGNGVVYWDPVLTDKGKQNCPQGAEGKYSRFIMSIPEPTEVTSIGVPSQMGGNTTSIVNFRIMYKHTHAFDLYARVTGDNNGYSGEAEARAVFALYDDGWHLEKWDRK